MTQFRRYESLRHVGHRSCNGIEVGEVYVFPKLDGANAQIWLDDTDKIWWGTRNRAVISRDPTDLQNFGQWVLDHEEKIRQFFEATACHRIYGEWLVPHTLKTYREDTWHQFWMFDAFNDEDYRYLPYNEWFKNAEYCDIPVVYPLAIIQNPSEAQLRHRVDNNTYLIQDGAGLGEGIVVKNYDWVNNNGEQTWMKIVRNEFKEKNRTEFGTMEIGGEFQYEVAIAEEYVTPELVGKVRAKIVHELYRKDPNMRTIGGPAPEGWQQTIEAENRGEIIPRLLETVFYDLIEDFIWLAIKKHKNPTIDFKKLRAQCIAQTKKYALDLF